MKYKLFEVCIRDLAQFENVKDLFVEFNGLERHSYIIHDRGDDSLKPHVHLVFQFYKAVSVSYVYEILDSLHIDYNFQPVLISYCDILKYMFHWLPAQGYKYQYSFDDIVTVF